MSENKIPQHQSLTKGDFALVRKSRRQRNTERLQPQDFHLNKLNFNPLGAQTLSIHEKFDTKSTYKCSQCIFLLRTIESYCANATVCGDVNLFEFTVRCRNICSGRCAASFSGNQLIHKFRVACLCIVLKAKNNQLDVLK